MRKVDLINNIEQNLSLLLSILSYQEYILFIRTNKIVNFYDKNIDKPYLNIIFSKFFLLKVNNCIKKKIQNI